ncbi:YheC/YheD family protein [Paenibacillus sp. J5C_2022]|uniref:YheC/YheD family endospore coat-associated protein n=1 Tax=Paenibacillus sp. J5C2022 TaxID=2977129 RepID=UPI0021D0EB2D|nr:YheC/YheD family protein [Paenibacillus sp. J5C2022]MCU6712426.1 YheC/YheD family protein [Paenibacillus sp. J5C2022]
MPQRTIVLGIAAAPPRQTSSASGAAMPVEPLLCREISLAGKREGVEVFAFSAADFDAAAGRLYGYCLEKDRWIRREVPCPDVIYDRRFFASRRDRARSDEVLSRLTELKPHRLLNGKLPSKLTVYNALSGDPVLQPLLPPTASYSAWKQLAAAAERYSRGIVLKPAAGMQGRGIMHVRRDPLTSDWVVRGRSKGNQPFVRRFRSSNELLPWITAFTKQSAFLLQPYLQLTGCNGKPYDVRSLMQKDAGGRWRCTGTSAREGDARSVTSNLHGGGCVRPALEALTANLGRSTAERLLSRIHTISGQAATQLERNFGRFGELAFDFGIEPNGKLWLLEANAKPGRDCWRRANNPELHQLSIDRLLQYARYLANAYRTTPALAFTK